ncbi:hypothetical protein [Streptomyces coffeae]|nr:hypothetical protein [Streptomyces coffeae]
MGDGEFAGDESDLDAVLWVPGVDYVSGWREAREAASELGDALRLVGVDTSGVRLRASAGTDGAGVVRLELSAATAREIAMLARVTAARLGRAS